MITFFHFSDLHLFPDSNTYEKYGINASTIIQNEVQKNNLRIDYILFTGDLAYKEQGFRRALDLFNEISNKLDVSRRRILFVPGNHEISNKSEEKGFSFSNFNTFITDFYRDDIKYIYGENWRDKFHEDNYSFDYLINDEVLISAFHQKSYEDKIVDPRIIDNKLIENRNKYANNKKLIKIAMLHEAIIPKIDFKVADLIDNVVYFVKKLVPDGYRIFLTGHSHTSDVILVNNQYVEISAGAFGLEKNIKSYNVIKIDGNTINVKSYSAGINLSDPFVSNNQRLFEIRKSGISELQNLHRWEINLKKLIKTLGETDVKRNVLDFLHDNGVDTEKLIELDNSPYVHLRYDVLEELGYLLGRQVDDLIIELQDVDEPVEIKTIYRGKEEGNEIRMECFRRNIIEDPIIKNFQKIYIDDVKFIQRDEATGKPNYVPGKYICIEPATGKHGSVVLPIDKDGNVLLVNQFRHPQRKFITEAIRGFSDFQDDNELITALREFSEEGGGPSLRDLEHMGLEDLLLELTNNRKYIHIKNEQCAIKDIFYLRNLYTDTGKLWEAPHYYLFHVDHKLQNNNITRKEPIMESPIWVNFKYVLRSIVQNKAIPLKNDEIENVFKQNNEYFSKINHLLKYEDPLIKDNKIYIEDAFTSQIIFLSLPILKRIIDHKLVGEIFRELNTFD